MLFCKPENLTEINKITKNQAKIRKLKITTMILLKIVPSKGQNIGNNTNPK